MVSILRIAWSLWILGIFVLALVATSILIFAPPGLQRAFTLVVGDCSWRPCGRSPCSRVPGATR
jgi:hypothetical protein